MPSSSTRHCSAESPAEREQSPLPPVCLSTMPARAEALGGSYERSYLSHWSDRRHHDGPVIAWSALGGAKQGERIMATNTRAAPVAGDTTLNTQWTAIIAGAVGAAALAFVLHTFAAAIGFSVSS